MVINLSKPTRQDVKKLCKTITKKEKIDLTDSDIDHILDLTNSTIYTIFNYLEKIKLIESKLYLYDVKELLTHINYKEFDKYFSYLRNKQFFESYSLLVNLHDCGYSVIAYLRSVN